MTADAMAGKIEIPTFGSWRACKRDKESIGEIPTCIAPNQELDKVEP